MTSRLNSIIKFDLHIHSKASEYKESSGIVENSTKANLDVLLKHLNTHQVALFSVTDHNRFDSELYMEINRILGEPGHPYPNVKGVLSGVEFDVIIDEGMEKCHIISIFDTQNEETKLRKIESAIDAKKLTKVDAAYPKNEFEDVLKKIGLNTILIASQRKDIHNQSGKHNSLSDSALDVEQIMRIGYINALEFQKPKVEGILLNNLKEISLPIPLFSGSDCHDWSCYPFHDNQNQNKEFHHSKAKILPTFKGLLMAVTSPETRFNCSENNNTSIIESLSVKGQNLPLVNGINAIIGENGSGKTTLLKVINEKTKEAHVKKLVQDNTLGTKRSIDLQKIKYIEQGQIIKRFNDKTLFGTGVDSNFEELDNTPFREAYTSYADALKQVIESSIKKQETISSLSAHEIAFEEGMSTTNYYVDIDIEAFESTSNPHEKARKDVKNALEKVEVLLKDSYFTPYKEQLEKAKNELVKINDIIEHQWKSADFDATVKNIIHGSIDDYLLKVKAQSSARDREIKKHNKKKQQVILSVLTAIKAVARNIEWPAEPFILEGATKNPKQGFYFNREAAYNGLSMVSNFHSKMFVKDYRKFSKLQEIISHETWAQAIMGCTSPEDISSKWTENFNKFIEEAQKTSDYIMDGTDQKIGNTLGEMSLSYYKFFTHSDQDWRVLIIDQPEDNISNNNISQKLNGYFNATRDEKQIIFVTHNPLLVVNLDVDNVIFIKNDNGTLSVHNGCLEYEDKDANILELIAQNMDGGKEAIEKRLKVYGKSN